MYESINDKLIDDVKVITISLCKNIKKPINIDINNTLKKLSFLLNFPEKLITTKPIITKKKGFSISDM